MPADLCPACGSALVAAARRRREAERRVEEIRESDEWKACQGEPCEAWWEMQKAGAERFHAEQALLEAARR